MLRSKLQKRTSNHFCTRRKRKYCNGTNKPKTIESFRFERLVVSELIADGTIKFYKRCVDDTLVLIKPSDISAILAKFNSFDPNLTFTVDTFSEGIVHFLDIKVSVDGTTDIYRKDIHTGQYSHFASFEPFYCKTASVKSLYHRGFKICSTKLLLNNQIEIIKSFMSWNGYPKSIQNFLMKKHKTKYSHSSTSVTVNEDTASTFALKFGFTFLISAAVAISF